MMGAWTRISERFALQRNVMVISLTLFAVLAAYFSWYLLLPLYLRQLGASNFQVGLSYALWTISWAAMQLAGGFLADKVGRKPMIVLPTFVAVLLYYLVGISRSWQTLVVFLVLVNSCSAIQWPAFLSMLAESVPNHRQGAAFSLMELFVVLGITVGPAVGAALLPQIGLPALMMITALVAFPCAVIRAIFLRETKARVPTEGGRRAPWLLQRRHGTFLVAAIFFALALTLTVYGPFIALYAKDIISLGESQINLMFALGGLAAVSLSLLGGKIIDRAGSQRVLMFCLLAFPLVLITWTLTRSFLWSSSIYVMSYLFFHAANISYQIQLTSIGPPTHRGSMVGIFGSISGMISAAGPLLGSFLASRAGAAMPFYGALAFSLLAFLFFLFLRGESRGEG
jgi:predicted MFS family arabinose efflux permease